MYSSPKFFVPSVDRHGSTARRTSSWCCCSTATATAAGGEADQKRDPEGNRKRRLGSTACVFAEHAVPSSRVALLGLSSAGPYALGAIRRDAACWATDSANAVRSAIAGHAEGSRQHAVLPIHNRVDDDLAERLPGAGDRRRSSRSRSTKTAAIRIPARMSGRPSGSSTRARICRSVKPMPRAASTMSRSTPSTAT